MWEESGVQRSMNKRVKMGEGNELGPVWKAPKERAAHLLGPTLCRCGQA